MMIMAVITEWPQIKKMAMIIKRANKKGKRPNKKNDFREVIEMQFTVK